MKRWGALLCVLLCAGILTACGSTGAEKNGVALYYASNLSTAHGGDAIAPVYVRVSEQEASVPEQEAADLLRRLMRGEGAGTLHTPIPEETRLLSCQVENGVARVDFSGAYGQLSGMDLTLADYCVTLTLTQIKGIFMVYITVNGKNLSYRDSNVFMASDVLLTSTEDIVRSMAVTLYYPDTANGALTGEERLLTWYEGQNQADVLLSELLAGPESDKLVRVIPEGFQVGSVKIAEGVCYLNLPQSDLALLPESLPAQQMIVRSLVKSLCSMEGIDAVQLLVGGASEGVTFGRIDISRPFTPTA